MHGPQRFHSESRDFGDYSHAFLSQLTGGLYIYSCQSNLLDLIRFHAENNVSQYNYDNSKLQRLGEGLFGTCSLDVVEVDDTI